MRNLYILFILLFTYSTTFAQAWDWTKTSGDHVSSVSIDPQQFFVTASSGGSGTITKRDRDGNLAWQKIFTKPGGTGMFGLVTDSYGNIYTSSNRYDSINHVYAGSKGAINKFDFNGNLLWSRSFKWLDDQGIDRGDICSTVISKDEQDNIYVTGIVGSTFGLNFYSSNRKIVFETDTMSIPQAASFIVLAKIDKNGNKQWIKAFKYNISGDYSHRTAITSIAVQNNLVAIAGTSNLTTISFDATDITGFKGTNFLTLLDAGDGHVKWVKNIKFNSFQFACIGGCDAAPARVLFSNSNKVVFSSAFMDTLRFAGILYTSYAKKQYYISQYDTSGTEEKFKIFPNDYLGSGDITISIPFYNEQAITNAGNGYYYHVLSHLYKLDSAYNISWTSTNTLWYPGAPYASSNHYALATDPSGQMVAQVSNSNGPALAGQETLNPAWTTYSYVSRINTDYNIISGYTFYDTNGNGIKDAGEQPAKNIVVGVATNNRFIGLSDTSGLYECLADTGTFTFSPLRIPFYHTLSPAGYTITTNSFNQHIINKDFALKPIPGVNDLMVDITSGGLMRPGFPGFYRVNIFNKGTTTQSGSCIVKLSANTQYNVAYPLPDVITTDSLIFNYAGLPPGARQYFTINFTCSPYMPIGDTVICYAAVTPVANDSVKSDNYDTLKTVGRGSFDPNEKEVNHSGNVSIDKKSDWLEYTIRFQNTGNDTAFNIRVIDTLQTAKLDIKTFELLSSTHPVQPLISNDKILTFYFNNILLVDSFQNELKSHGMVKFRIKPVGNIQVNDSITNRASIYFDYNQPVLTNTVKTKYIIAAPIVNLGNDITICGGPVILNAGNTGSRFVWNTGDTLQTLSVTTTGTFWVRVTNSYGFSANDTIQVTINAKPVVNLGNDIIQCGGNVTLNAGNAGSTYLWSTAAVTQNIFVNSTGTYHVKVTNAAGCFAVDTIQVTINAAPVVDLGNDIVQCGGSAILNAGNPGNTYLWNTGAVTQNISTTTSGAYSVKVSNALGCFAMDTVNVNIQSLPAVNLGADTMACEGNNVTLNAGNSGSVFLWSTGAATQTISINSNGNYFVKVTNSNGCSRSDTVQVSFRAKPAIILNFPDTVNINDQPFLLLASPAAGVFTGGAIVNGMFKPAQASAGKNTITYSYTDANGCSNSRAADIFVTAGTGSVTVYPNPNHGTFNVTVVKELRNSLMKLIAPSGKIIAQFTISAMQQQFSFNVPAGVYFLQFTNNDFKTIKKIIVQ